MSNSQYTIRNMIKSDLELALEWADQEGWNPGLHDANCFYNTDPHGFFMGWLNNEPISSVSVVAYNSTYGFVGFYIVKPKYRGHNYGIKIWQHAMKYAGDRNLGLDSIAEQQPNYIQSGFKIAYHDITHKGFSQKYPLDSRIIDLKKINFEMITNYDRDCFPVKRDQFLNCWINSPDRTALGYVDNRQLQGFGIIRKCQSWYKIGPLFADDGQIAEKILQGLMSSLPEGSEVGLDIPEINQIALQLAARHHLSEAFRLGRMYTQSPPKINLQKIFSVTSYELG